MRNYLFVCTLLAALSITYSIPLQLHKRATTFMPCDQSVNPFDVVIAPDPPTPGDVSTFNISGTLSEPATTGSLLEIFFFQPGTTNLVIDPANQTIVDICSGINNFVCPGSSFTNVTVAVLIPNTMPADIAVIAVGPTGNTLGCAFSSSGGGAAPGGGGATPSGSAPAIKGLDAITGWGRR